MKTSAKQYANILLSKTASAKNADELKKILEAFAHILVEDGMVGKFPEIMKIFGKLWDKERGTIDAFISTSEIKDFDIKTLHLPKHINARVAEDKSLLGGISIMIEDYIIDNSIKNNLGKLKDALVLRK